MSPSLISVTSIFFPRLARLLLTASASCCLSVFVAMSSSSSSAPPKAVEKEVEKDPVDVLIDAVRLKRKIGLLSRLETALKDPAVTIERLVELYDQVCDKAALGDQDFVQIQSRLGQQILLLRRRLRS